MTARSNHRLEFERRWEVGPVERNRLPLTPAVRSSMRMIISAVCKWPWYPEGSRPHRTSANLRYVWAFDRGGGTSRFPVIAPGVTFDSVLSVTIGPPLSGLVNRLVGGGTTSLPASAIDIAGATITVDVEDPPTRDMARLRLADHRIRRTLPCLLAFHLVSEVG